MFLHSLVILSSYLCSASPLFSYLQEFAFFMFAVAGFQKFVPSRRVVGLACGKWRTARHSGRIAKIEVKVEKAVLVRDPDPTLNLKKNCLDLRRDHLVSSLSSFFPPLPCSAIYESFPSFLQGFSPAKVPPATTTSIFSFYLCSALLNLYFIFI